MPATDVIGLIATLTLLAIILYHAGLSVYRDARRRGLPAVWIVVAVMCTWPIGHLLYSFIAWRWPAVHCAPTRGLDLATWFRASWVGLFWLIAALACCLPFGALVGGRSGGWLTYLVASSASGFITALSYEERIVEPSWRMRARLIALGLGTLSAWTLLVEMLPWWEYGRFAFDATSWGGLLLRQSVALATWCGGGVIALMRSARGRATA